MTPRTVYRDIATLQARRVPIEGEAGVGYVLRRGFDLPPLMLTDEEVEAIAVGMRLLRRTGDPGLEAAARNVLTKLTAAMPEILRERLISVPFRVAAGARRRPVRSIPPRSARPSGRAQGADRLRGPQGRYQHPATCPVAMEYHVQATLICGWCELRNDYRHFRADRIVGAEVLADSFAPAASQLTAGWLALTQGG